MELYPFCLKILKIYRENKKEYRMLKEFYYRMVVDNHSFFIDLLQYHGDSFEKC